MLIMNNKQGNKMNKILIISISLTVLFLIFSSDNSYAQWVNERGGNIYGDSRINPDADPRINPDADPRINPDADPRINPDADPRINPCGMYGC